MSAEKRRQILANGLGRAGAAAESHGAMARDTCKDWRRATHGRGEESCKRSLLL